jgi:hypothetical protein
MSSAAYLSTSPCPTFTASGLVVDRVSASTVTARSQSAPIKAFTATDVVVAEGRAPGVGDASLVKQLDPDLVEAAQARIRVIMELAIDSMKTSTQDVPVYLVGGGAILAPDSLKGVSKVHRFPFYDAANAVGAACAQISGIVDTFEDTSTKSIAQVRKMVEQRAIDKAVTAGANPDDCKIVESEAIPIACGSGNGGPASVN